MFPLQTTVFLLVNAVRQSDYCVQQTIAIAEKTVRLFLSSKAVVSSKPVNKPSSISSKTVVFSDNLSSIVVVSAIVVSAIAVVSCTYRH